MKYIILGAAVAWAMYIGDKYFFNEQEFMVTDFKSGLCFYSSTRNSFLSGIIGSQFTPVKSLATLPMALSIVAIAIFAIFAAKVMSIIGRRAGFMLASIVSSLSSILAAYSIINESFILFNFHVSYWVQEWPSVINTVLQLLNQ